MRFLLLLLFIVVSPLSAQEIGTWEVADIFKNITFFQTKSLNKNLVSSPDGKNYLIMGSMGTEKLWTSQDSGRTFSLLTKTGTFIDVAYPISSTIILLVKDNSKRQSIQISNDNGLTWKSIPMTDSIVLDRISMCDSHNGIILQASYGSSYNDSLLVTEDGWETWTKVAVPVTKPFTNDISCPEPKVFILDGIMRTTDAGKTWVESLSPPQFANKYFFINRRLGWAVGMSSNGIGQQQRDIIYETKDGGQNWTLNMDKSNELPWGLVNVAFADSLHGIAVGRSRKILRTNDGGRNWSTENLPSNVPNTTNFSFISYPTKSSALTLGQGGYVLRYHTSLTLGVPTITLPNKDEFESPIQIDISWNKIASATRYHIQVSDSDNFDTIFLQDSSIADTTKTVTLTYNGRFAIRVRAINEAQQSDWSPTRIVRTKASAEALKTPNFIYPALEQNDVPLNVELSWNSIPNAKKYHVQFSDGVISQSSTLLINDSTIMDTSLLISNLKPSTTYFAVIRAYNADLTSDWSSKYYPQLRFTTTTTMGIDESTISSVVKVYPNPATDYLDISSEFPVVSIEIIGIDSKIVSSIVWPHPKNNWSVNVSYLPSGNYIVKIHSINHVINRILKITR